MRSLMEMLPEYYRGVRFAEELQGAAQCCADLAEEYLLDSAAQLQVSTCSDDFLSRYEAIYGVTGRENVLAKKRSTGVLTISKLKAILSAYGCGDCEIIEDVPSFRVTIRFLTVLGEPPDFGDVVKLLRELLPAHIEVGYELRWNTWDDTSDETYTEFNDVSWSTLAIMEGVK